MKARAVKPNSESPSLQGRSRSLASPIPVQAKHRASGVAQWPKDTKEERVEDIFRRGRSFGDVPVYSQQRSVNPDQAGNPLPAQLQQKMESAFGSDFSDVRVHQGPSADSLGALAFTQGRDIHFAPGQYNPASAEGQRIIAHELTHVVQQRQGRVAVPLGSGVPLNASASLESEADTLSARAVRGESVTGAAAHQGRTAGTSVAPVQGMMSKLFGSKTKKQGGQKYNQLIDEDELEAQEMEKLKKSQEKALESQTKENISRHYGNLHSKAQRGSKVANKVGKVIGHVGKGVTLLSGGMDMGIGAMTGKGIETTTKGVTKGIEKYNEYKDYQDPQTRQEATPLIPKVKPKSNVQSKVEMGGTIGKGLVTVGNEVGGFFGAPELPTEQINKGIDVLTKGGTKLAQKYDEQQNEKNMETGSKYEENEKILEDYYSKNQDDWEKF